jgi:hypothetical protein
MASFVKTSPKHSVYLILMGLKNTPSRLPPWKTKRGQYSEMLKSKNCCLKTWDLLFSGKFLMSILAAI